MSVNRREERMRWRPLRHHAAIVHDTVQLRPYLELEQMVPAIYSAEL